MKIINKYIYSNIIKILFSTLILTTLLLLSVDLFSNFDSYVQNNASWYDILNITLLYIPQALIIVFAPSTLFAITFFLSQMHTNNEVIALLSSGISTKHIYKMIFIIISIISICLFLFNENIVLESKIKYNNLKNTVFNINTNFDNSNIGLIDSYNNNVVYANRYIEKDQTLYEIVVVQKDTKNKIIQRIDAKKGVWDDKNKNWILSDVLITNIENEEIDTLKQDSYENKKISLEPSLFRSLDSNVQTMYFSNAIKYLSIQKKVNLRLWYENMSDFLDRLLEPFSILIMTIIACSIDYRGRKNVFLFSVFNSIILAVVYYVSKMVFQIVSKQGFINPFFASIIPYLLIIIVTLIFNKIKRISSLRNS